MTRSKTAKHDGRKPDGLLRKIAPFSHLGADEREKVEAQLEYLEFEPSAMVIQVGDQVEHFFIVARGGFYVVDAGGRIHADAFLGPDAFFGERGALFNTKSAEGVRARDDEDGSAVWALKSHHLLELVRSRNARFSLSLASTLRRKQGLFDHFSSFCAFVMALMHEPSGKSIDFTEMLNRYRTLGPAIHAHANNADLMDFDAWRYALLRLPTNITSVFSIVCSRRVINVLMVQGLGDHIPVETSESGDTCESDTELEFVVSSLSPGQNVGVEGRRRTCWEVMPGKDFILLRGLESDFLDICSTMSIHAIESEKLRNRLRPIGNLVPIIQRGIKRLKRSSAKGGGKEREITHQVIQEIAKGRLDRDEIAGLLHLWPAESLLQNLLNVLIHHGDYNLFLDSHSNTYSTSADDRWCERVRHLTEDLIGPFDIEDDTDLIVDIISSNTHGVLNVLSPYTSSHKEEILAWGRENVPELFRVKLQNEEDRLYPVLKEYFAANPEKQKEARECERAAGIAFMQEREFTGVSVQLYDLDALKAGRQGFDPLVKRSKTESLKGRRHLLVNIDYCFGNQAEVILTLLLLTFGKAVRSVNILGKAGGLIGNRGDILFPTHTLDETRSGQITTLDNSDIDPARLNEMSGRDVHIGPIITVIGTVLQSTELLKFYEHLWHATGMEMELSFYSRAIEQALTLKIVPPQLKSRMLYYVSDTPLKPSGSLANKMGVFEGSPPLYAITRLILEKVLDLEDVVASSGSEAETISFRTVTSRST